MGKTSDPVCSGLLYGVLGVGVLRTSRLGDCDLFGDLSLFKSLSRACKPRFCSRLVDLAGEAGLGGGGFVGACFPDGVIT